MKREDYELLIRVLKNQVVPALGCTEPGAVAYAVARTRDLLGEEIIRMSVRVDKNILKNGMRVGIPGTREQGIVFAAALALVSGNPEDKLEVLKDITDADIAAARGIMARGMIDLSLDAEAPSLKIDVRAEGRASTARVMIENSHTNVVMMEKNGEIMPVPGDERVEESVDAVKQAEIKYEIKQFTIKELIAFAQEADIADIAFIRDGIDMNRRIVEYGVEHRPGIGMGRLFETRAKNSFEKAKAMTVVAAEARMDGGPLPVMSSAGSGNHGLVAIIPISIVGMLEGYSDKQILRAVTLSHLVTIFVKAYLGSLNPVCGCGVAAGVGCAAGLVQMMNGSPAQICAAISNMAAGLSGMLCDGAKVGCAYKLAISVDAAIDASDMALKNIEIPSNNGILGETAEQTVINLARVATQGMGNADSVVLDILMEQC